MSQFIVQRPAELMLVFARLYRHDLQEWFAAESVERAPFQVRSRAVATIGHGGQLPPPPIDIPHNRYPPKLLENYYSDNIPMVSVETLRILRNFL